MINDCLFWGNDSQHLHCSHVLATHQGSSEVQLAVIHYFVECQIITDLTNQSWKKYFAVVSWFEPHQCKVWFGSPTQVWCTTFSEQFSFLSLSKIKCRVVYSKSSVSFGGVIGTDTVLVVAPI